jgi:hypothetical protein
MASTYNARSADRYEQMMGRWSRVLARTFMVRMRPGGRPFRGREAPRNDDGSAAV